MPKNKKLRVRIDEGLNSKLQKMIDKINEETDLEMSQSSFIRMAIRNFISEIQTSGLEIKIGL